jgi:hypothetical protein
MIIMSNRSTKSADVGTADVTSSGNGRASEAAIVPSSTDDDIEVVDQDHYGSFFEVGQECDLTVSGFDPAVDFFDKKGLAQITGTLRTEMVNFRNQGAERYLIPAGTKITVTGGPWHLDDGLKKLRPDQVEPGKRVKITYLGEVTGAQSGNKSKRFKVEGAKRGPTVNLSEFPGTSRDDKPVF